MSKKVIIDNKYEVRPYVNCWAVSYERGVKSGDLRVIGGKLMAAQVQYPFTEFFGIVLKNEISWAPFDHRYVSYTLKDVHKWKMQGL